MGKQAKRLMSASDSIGQPLLSDQFSDDGGSTRCSFLTRNLPLVGLAVATLLLTLVCVHTPRIAEFIHQLDAPGKIPTENDRDEGQLAWRNWVTDDCRQLPSPMLCPATCVSSTPVFPCMVQLGYPVLFSLSKDGEERATMGSCREPMFTWRAPLEDKVGGVELGEGRLLSDVHLQWSASDETTWTASFFGGNRFLRHRHGWYPDHKWTQCACYFFTGRLPSMDVRQKLDHAARPAPGNTTGLVIEGATLSQLMQSGPFSLYNFMVGRPTQSWSQSIGDACAPYSEVCTPLLGLSDLAAKKHFTAPPWRENYNQGCRLTER